MIVAEPKICFALDLVDFATIHLLTGYLLHQTLRNCRFFDKDTVDTYFAKLICLEVKVETREKMP